MSRLNLTVRVAGLLGATALVVAEFTTLLSVQSRGETVARASAGAHHGYALLLLGLAAGGLAWLAARPGAARYLGLLLLVVGAAAVLVVVAIDVPDLGRDGLYGSVDRPATSSAGAGFYLESAGAILVLLAGGLAVIAPGGASDSHRRT